MASKLIAISAVALATLAGNAAAAPFLDFEGSADGALIQNFYNGGTDSLGNRGFDYGITFGSSATVRVDHGRTYLTNIGQINVADGFTKGMTFLYSTYNWAGITPSIADTQDFRIHLDGNDGQYLGNTYNDACNAYPNTYCNFGAGFAFADSGVTVHTVTFGAPNSGPDASIPLYQVALDSITFNVAPNLGNLGLKGSFIGDYVSSAVPEPTTVALLGLGLLGFATSRRRPAKNKNV
jgi:hypothetical protein